MFLRLILVFVMSVFLWAVFVRPSEGAGPERAYVVKPTDTLWSIAASHYGGDPREAVWKIRQRNGLDGAVIRPGERLILPRR